MNHAQPGADAASSAAAGAGPRPRILVADDEQPIRELLTAVLTPRGYQVAAAADGQQALERIQQEKFDLVLLDVWMPRLNGLEVLSRLHSTPAPPRVIVMTADQTPETLLHALKEEAYQCVSKPFSLESMAELVDRVLSAPSQAGAIEVISRRPQWIQLLVPCERESVDRIEAVLMNLRGDLSEQARRDIGQAFHELLLNAIEWGGRLDPNRRVYIGCLRTKRMILYKIGDPGGGFRFEGLEHAAVSNPEGEALRHLEARNEKGLRPGGFGILITRALVDELIYNEAQNEVVCIKYLD